MGESKMHVIDTWAVYGNAFEDVSKRECILYLVLEEIETGKLKDVSLLFNEGNIETIETIFMKQVIPHLKGEKIARGEWASDKRAKKLEERISKQAHYR